MGLDPISWAAIGLVVAGTGVKAYSEVQAGKASQAISNYNADVTQQAADYNADLTTATAAANAAKIQQAADYNATLAGQNAGVALKDSAIMANLQRVNNQRLMGSQRARIAASGVVGDTGSPLLVQAAQAGFLEMRALETERQGALMATNIANQSSMDSWKAGEEISLTKWQAAEQAKMERWSGQSQATLDRMQGSAARRAGNLNAFGTILSGAGKAVGSYYGIT